MEERIVLCNGFIIITNDPVYWIILLPNGNKFCKCRKDINTLDSVIKQYSK